MEENMWYFEAYYINMDDDTESKRAIKFDGQFFKNEEEIYIYAMTKAYKEKKKNETLVSLEFVAC
jgi:hypothetical protein